MQKEIDYSKRTSLDEIPEDFFKISSGICICIRLIDIDYNEYLNNSDYKNLVVNLPYCTDWIRLRCLNWEEKQTITLVFECLHEETDPPSGTQVLIEQFREKTQVDIFLGHKDRLAFGVFQLTFISEINVICNLLKDNLSLNMLLDKISAPELVSTEDLFSLNQYVISGGPGVEKDIKPISRESFVFDEYRIELYNQSLLDGLGFFLTYSNLDFYESFIRGEVEFQKFLSDHTEIMANSAFSLIYAICFGTCKRYTPLFIKQMQHAINHEPEIPCLKQGDYISGSYQDYCQDDNELLSHHNLTILQFFLNQKSIIHYAHKFIVYGMTNKMSEPSVSSSIFRKDEDLYQDQLYIKEIINSLYLETGRIANACHDVWGVELLLPFSAQTNVNDINNYEEIFINIIRKRNLLLSILIKEYIEPYFNKRFDKKFYNFQTISQASYEEQLDVYVNYFLKMYNIIMGCLHLFYGFESIHATLTRLIEFSIEREIKALCRLVKTVSSVNHSRKDSLLGLDSLIGDILNYVHNDTLPSHIQDLLDGGLQRCEIPFTHQELLSTVLDIIQKGKEVSQAILDKEKAEAAQKERELILYDLSHSIKNIIVGIKAPIMSIALSKSNDPSFDASCALEGANMISNIVWCINNSYRSTQNDFIEDISNPSDDALTFGEITAFSLRNAIANMLDKEFHCEYAENYFSLCFDEAYSVWKSTDNAQLVKFINTYMANCDLEISEECKNHIIGNAHGSATKIMIIINEIFLNALKAVSFIRNKEQRVINIQINLSSDGYLHIDCRNSFKGIGNGNGHGQIIVDNFIKSFAGSFKCFDSDHIFKVLISIPFTFKNQRRE